MYCSGCGNEIQDGSTFCPACGTQQNVAASMPQVNEAQQQAAPNPTPQGAYQQPGQPGQPGNDKNYKPFGIAGMVLGIVGVICVFFVPPVGTILGAIGLVLAGYSMSVAKGRSNGMGIAGLVCSIIAVAIGLPVCICTLCVVGSGTTAASSLGSLGYYLR